jgi:hypothetical protein
MVCTIGSAIEAGVPGQPRDGRRHAAPRQWWPRSPATVVSGADPPPSILCGTSTASRGKAMQQGSDRTGGRMRLSYLGQPHNGWEALPKAEPLRPLGGQHPARGALGADRPSQRGLRTPVLPHFPPRIRRQTGG